MSKHESLQIADTAQEATQPRGKAPLAVGLPIFFAVLALLAAGVYWTYQYLHREQGHTVEELVFSGDMQILNQQQLKRVILPEITQSFFAVDVNKVHQLIQSQPWVYSASVRKRWPSKLYIHIQEQQAVAVWNNDLLLNESGDSFAGFDGLDIQSSDNYVTSLPRLFGPGGSEKTALTAFSHMQSLLSSRQQTISELVLSERHAWQAKLSNNVLLKLGRQQYINRLQRYIDVLPILESEQKTVEYVDLRYDTGLAVGWKKTDSPTRSTSKS